MNKVVYTIQVVELASDRLSGVRFYTFQYADYGNFYIDRYIFNFFNCKSEVILIRAFNQDEDVVAQYSRAGGLKNEVDMQMLEMFLRT